MTHPPVLVLGYSEAAMLLRAPGETRVDAIITIAGQGEYAVSAEGVPHYLHLEFDDTEAPESGDLLQAARVRIRQREAAEIGLRLTPPAPDHARRVIDFARSIHDIEGHLLCQCRGGVSRSPAAALLCLATWTGPGHEAYCADYLQSVRACALPHRDLVLFGDKLLDRGGALVEAARRFDTP